MPQWSHWRYGAAFPNLPMFNILGIGTDAAGRCTHWHIEVDIIANKCQQCRAYYACYLCHNTLTTHEFVPVAKTALGALCGSCGLEMTGNAYLTQTACPRCQHAFNPQCHLHQQIYFC